MTRTTAAMTCLVAAMSVSAPQAQGATSAANAAGFCQAALPAYEGNIRKRPLGVNNEGTASAFVSCSVATGHNPEVVSNAAVILSNATAAPISVNCTLVNGGLATNVGYFPKTLEVPPNATAAIVWTLGEFQLTTFSLYENFSCNLPPGISINVVGYDYTPSD